MYTIAFDESGRFENSGQDLVLIAGLIYDDNKNDVKAENIRIAKYLKTICEECGGTYPYDLHSAKLGGSKKVNKIKRRILNSFGEFLSSVQLISEDKDKRKGPYHLFAYIKSNAGKPELIGPEANELIRDNYASNLYVHMSEEILTRLIFHNPVINDIRSVSLDLATRVSKVNKKSGRSSEYTKLGYKATEQHGENLYSYQVANADNYRTVIEREMMLTRRQDIEIKELKTRSIQYNSDRMDMGFLYLCDLICSYVRWIYTDSGSIQAVSDGFDALTGHTENLVFGYDAVDDIYNNAWRAFERRDYYEALKYVYQGRHTKGGLKNYYVTKWFGRIENLIISSGKKSSISRAIDDLYNSTLQNNINQAELMYIYGVLERTGDVCSSNIKYKLYDTGIAVYNHLGHSTEAVKCFEKCVRLAEYADIEQYLRTRNRAVVAMCDSLNFCQALDTVRESISLQTKISELRQVMYNNSINAKYDPSLGRCYSQEGQILSFMGNDEAEKSFMQALGLFYPESADLYITRSYLMHYYIEIKNKNKYQEIAIKFFDGKKDLYVQFKRLIAMSFESDVPRVSLKFALYAYIKALHFFYMDELMTDKRIQGIVLDIKDSITKECKMAQSEINGHPWELIYKYLALLALKLGEYDTAKGYMKKVGTAVKYQGLLIKCINEYAWIEYDNALGNDSDIMQHKQKILDLLKHHNPELADKTHGLSEQAISELLQSSFSYMYH